MGHHWRSLGCLQQACRLQCHQRRITLITMERAARTAQKPVEEAGAGQVSPCSRTALLEEGRSGAILDGAWECANHSDG